MTPREFLLKTNQDALTFKNVDTFGFDRIESNIIDKGMKAKHEFYLLIQSEMIHRGYLAHANHYAMIYISCLKALENIEKWRKERELARKNFWKESTLPQNNGKGFL